ncbi:DinB family protein [Paenibacillus sambharensis]|uniref:DinB family protein n=1 Tax=Paenibacillus sambharensis TaxID=1803190 RepID=A0A2W1LH38_9BACL|nr:DinB family protein [Paenibacillus sambharensis]PZD93774.1 DinB family protein [Paenibacillus sambharensis]
MEHYLFDQMAFVRSQTLRAAGAVTEEAADQIPDGFRNSIRWNLGHIYVVAERIYFQYLGLPMRMPEGFREQFDKGTSPLNQSPSSVPTLAELTELLSSQEERMRQLLSNRMQEQLVPPYTTSLGVTLATPEQFVSFSLFHEGMHLATMKAYLTLLSRK